jgi:hypothetical protein
MIKAANRPCPDSPKSGLAQTRRLGTEQPNQRALSDLYFCVPIGVQTNAARMRLDPMDGGGTTETRTAIPFSEQNVLHRSMVTR